MLISRDFKIMRYLGTCYLVTYSILAYKYIECNAARCPAFTIHFYFFNIKRKGREYKSGPTLTKNKSSDFTTTCQFLMTIA